MTTLQGEGQRLLGDTYRPTHEQRVELLRRILAGDSEEAASKGARLVLMGNPLEDLIAREQKRREHYLSLYRESHAIQALLISTLKDFEAGRKPRKSFGPGMFTGEQGRLNCVILTRHVLEEKLGMSFAEVMQKTSFRLLYSHRLRCAKVCFRHLADLIIACYPEKELKPYHFKNYRLMWFDKDGSFRDEMARKALREFIETLIRGDRTGRRKLRNIPRWLTFRMFQQQLLPYNRSLSYLLNLRFGNSHIKAVMFAFPELRLRPHYFRHVPRGYWKGAKGKGRAREVVREFVDILSDPKGRYKFSRKEAVGLVKFTTLQKPVLPFRKRLGGMLRVVYGNSAPRAREEIPA